MTNTLRSIKLSNDLLDDAQRQAEVLQRSLGAQVEYWARLGRALEATPGFDLDLIRETLNGNLRLDGLTASEQSRALDAMSAAFDAPDDATRAHFAALGEQPGAVGTDGKSGVIRRRSPSPSNKER